MGRIVSVKRKGVEPWRVLVWNSEAVPQHATVDEWGTPVRIGAHTRMFNGEEVIVVGIQYAGGHTGQLHKDGTRYRGDTVQLQHASLFRHWYDANIIGAVWVEVHLPDEV